MALNGTVAAQGQKRGSDTPSNPRRLTTDPCNKVTLPPKSFPKSSIGGTFLLTAFLHALTYQLLGTMFGISFIVMKRARMSLGFLAKKRLSEGTLSACESHPISTPAIRWAYSNISAVTILDVSTLSFNKTNLSLLNLKPWKPNHPPNSKVRPGPVPVAYLAVPPRNARAQAEAQVVPLLTTALKRALLIASPRAMPSNRLPPGGAASSSGCVGRPRGRETGLTGYAEPIQRSWPTGGSAMETAEHREPYESRGSRTDLGAPGGESPPGDSTFPAVPAHQRRGRLTLISGPPELERAHLAIRHPPAG